MRDRARRIYSAVLYVTLGGVAACGGGGASRSAAIQPAADDIPSNICRGIDNSYECAQVIERYQLSRGVKDVARSGDRLVITLASGESTALVNVEGSSGIAYTYRRFLPALDRYLIAAHYWEGREYLLVDARSGERVEIQSLPVVAPDGARFVTTSSDLGAEYNPTAIQIWRVKDERLKLEWSFEPLVELSLPSDSVWGPTHPVWLSSREIRIRKEYVSGEPGDYIFVRLGPDGWILVEGES